MRRFPKRTTRRSSFDLAWCRVDAVTRAGEERNIGLKGRRLYARFFVAALVRSAAVLRLHPSATVTWHRDGVFTWERRRAPLVAPQDGPSAHGRRRSGALEGDRCRAAPAMSRCALRYAQRDGGRVRRSVLARRSSAPHAAHRRRGHRRRRAVAVSKRTALTHMAYMARSAMRMIATAYTADSAGGSGMTAIGRRAGYGIVAVDPRVIPFGNAPLYTGIRYRRLPAIPAAHRRESHRSRLRFAARRDALRPPRRYRLSSQVA